MKKILLSAILLSFLAGCAGHPEREVTLLDTGWKFTREDNSGFVSPEYDDSSWQDVTVPHDWAIAGPFDMSIDSQKVKVIEDGETTQKLRAGRTGALPFVGTGWYRYDLGTLSMKDGARYRLEFDGAMSNARVYINGEQVAEWPYGYTSFAVDITDFLKERGNLLAVRLENKEQSSRWYPGAGLYRNVRLVRMASVHVKYCGTFVHVNKIEGDNAVVNITTSIENTDASEGNILRTTVKDTAGIEVAMDVASLSAESQVSVEQKLTVGDIVKWSIENPALYTVVSTIENAGKVLDTYTTTFGIRESRFDPDAGYFLNGERVPIKGVCMHHDLGPLGAAVNVRAIERQLEILKDMGCNAIRTSHNPPAPELLDLCDRMGFLVIVESFDEWRMPKNKNGYAQFFDEWAEKDMVAMIHRDRNHPCVIAWSIGNEIREQYVPEGVETAEFLADICRREDPYRPVTVGLNNYINALKHGFGDVVDLAGFNYKPFAYAEMHKKYPGVCIYGSETASTVSSRGKYYFPAVETNNPYHADFHCSSYDVEYPRWASSPDTEFEGQDENGFVSGEFVWTGFDYLGEPTPYNETVSSRSSYFGIMDLAGIKKDRFYIYQSRWSGKPVLHILPHWNWNAGDIVPVHCYTSYDEVELFLNGNSLGRRKKQTAGKEERYRLVWENVCFEAGELRAVAYDKDGNAAEDICIRTAGKPEALVCVPDRTEISADGKDLSFVEISVVDAEGTLCPDAELQLNVKVRGGELVALCNGDPTSLESFSGNSMKAFGGKCVAVVRSARAGKITVEVEAAECISGVAKIISNN